MGVELGQVNETIRRTSYLDDVNSLNVTHCIPGNPGIPGIPGNPGIPGIPGNPAPICLS